MAAIFYRPRATFQEINNRPTWLLPFLGAVIFNVGYAFLFFNADDVPVAGRAVLYGSYAAGVLLSVLICSAVFLFGLFLLGAQVGFKKVFSVVAHTYFLYTLINVILGTLILKVSSTFCELGKEAYGLVAFCLVLDGLGAEHLLEDRNHDQCSSAGTGLAVALSPRRAWAFLNS